MCAPFIFWSWTTLFFFFHFFTLYNVYWKYVSHCSYFLETMYTDLGLWFCLLNFLTWHKFSFPFSNNIKEQQVSKKKAWSLPLYRFNINLNRPGQVKAGQQIFYLYKGRSGCQQTQRDETLRNRV